MLLHAFVISGGVMSILNSHSLFKKHNNNILSRVAVTRDEVRIGNLIYYSLTGCNYN
jgi:hypothetical protein